MTIDIHVHPPRRKDSRGIDQMIAVAQRAGVDLLCLLGRVGENGPDPTPSSIQEANTETIELVRMHPDACCGMTYLSAAHDRQFILEEIQRTVVEGPSVGIKLWIAVNARDERLDPIMERAAELDIPVLHHSWYKTVDKRFNESTPADMAHLAQRHPQTKLIMAHLNGCGWRGVADIKPHPNVHVDTSGSQPEHGLVEYAAEELGAERILYGSDAPGRDFACQLGKVLGANLSETEREAILGGNAQRLLKL